MDINDKEAPVGKKYSVDTALFDSLVDKASDSAGSDAAAVGESRTLKQRLLELNKADTEYLVDLISDRLAEGKGETILEVGIQDDGSSVVLADADIDRVTAAVKRVAEHPEVGSFSRLLFDSGNPGEETSAAKALPTYARDLIAAPTAPAKPGSSVSKRAREDAKQAASPTAPSSNGRRVYYLIRRKPASVEEMLEVRVAVAGNVDAGKSTMLGVLTQGQLDDGRGKARVALFRHKHEVESGRTSSVGMEILGFDTVSGDPIRHTDAHRKVGWDTVCTHSSKLISFLDLAGHEKYLKTTVFGMAGGSPDFVMLMVAANAGLTGMAKEHLGLALALGVPVFVVITKIDMCPPHVLDATLKQLTKVLRSSGCRKIPIAVRDRESVVSTAARFVNQRICPVFQISNVTGEGVGHLQTFLNILPLNHRYHAATTSNASDSAQKPRDEFRFEISETFTVPFVGTVVSGVVSRGKIKAGDTVWLGPDFLGHFTPTVIKTIQRKRVDVNVAYAGQSVSFGLKKVKRTQVRKGMVLLEKSSDQEPSASRTFEAEVVVLYHSTTIASRYQAMLHCGSVRQTARVLSIRQPESQSGTLRTGDRANVVFQFIRHPEYLLPGTRLIFREGRTKGVGKVMRILDKAQEYEAVSEATSGTMVFDQRSLKAKSEALRHANAQAFASQQDRKVAAKG
ncbi:P-loop containing nucleoside triphosphate hydrolase protein [Martensiomyces pterosporus]|nr:P-loop containing nucleoside triphosphate hydrolase protein [Martensiomyces pterosporus]